MTCLLGFLALTTGADPPLPTATLLVAKKVFVVGEPIGVEFIVENNSDEIIPSAYFNEKSFSEGPLVLEFSGRGVFVATWAHLTSCGLREIGGSPIPGTDRWDMELGSHALLRARFSVVPKLIKPIRLRHEEIGPLAPGQYDLVGVIPWIEEDKPLRTAPVRIEIVESAREDERQAGSLIDYSYISLFSDARDAFSDFQPRESVAKILELYPQSIHAVRIRNQITLLSAEWLLNRPPKAVLADERLRSVAHQVESDVKEGLAHKTNDILDLDILDQSARLFLRLEWVEQLEMTSKILDERYPDTEQAKTAREELAKLKARQRP